jgi:hypothetical protein
METRFTRRLAAVAMSVITLAAVGASSPADAQDTGQVRVVHGLRGLVADIYLDGTLVLPTFQPERSTDPLAIPVGDHLVEIRQAGAAASDTPLLTQTVTVPAGFVGSLIAHLDRDGNATLTAFADDLSTVPAGESRVVVRHAAAAEDVTVSLNQLPAFDLVTSKAEAARVVAAGPYQVAVSAVGGSTPLAAPQDVQYPDGTANFMYLIGSQTEGTLGWAAVQIGNLQTPPAMIQTGDGSTATEPGGIPVAVLAVLATLLVGGGVVAWRRRPSA